MVTIIEPCPIYRMIKECAATMKVCGVDAALDLARDKHGYTDKAGMEPLRSILLSMPAYRHESDV